MVESEKNIEDEIADVRLEDLYIKYKKDDEGKGKVKVDLTRANQAKQEKQTRDDVDLVDVDEVDLYYALYLENRVTKLEENFTRLLKANKAKEAKKAWKAELKKWWIYLVMKIFLETPTTSRGPRRQLASTSTSNIAPIASTKKLGPRCVLALFAPNASPPFPSQKGSPSLSHTVSSVMYVDVLDIFGLFILCFVLSLAMYVDA
nr:hypothetical protein [Tanacetum cinerariifolium]